MTDLPTPEGLHPATAAILRHFRFSHLTDARAKWTSERIARLATDLAEELAGTDDGAELTTGLRKLLEAKDCLVRAALSTP